ncbi:flagellar hook-length control protein FliK [Tissierella praeacuta]|uniref:flagellar hook-length control protein FliK n=1 Tax=Tissierella praeacuta TaxID=43131 RepID=UPI0033411ED4
MEAIVFDFKNSLKSNAESSIKKDLIKTKDFSSTLESINNKSDNKVSSQNNSNKITSNFNDKKDIDLSKEGNVQNENKDVESDVVIEEENDKDYSLVYENIMSLFTNTINIADDSIENKETKLDVDANVESLDIELDLENNLDENNEVIIQNQILDTVIKENVEIADTNKIGLNYESGITDNTVKEDKLPNNEIKTNFKLLLNGNKEENNEEMTIVNESNLNYVEQPDEKMEFNLGQKNNNHSSSSFKENLDTAELEETDKDIKLNMESFISMDKNGIKFEKDNFIKLEDLDIIDQKEVIQQIVESAKIDLSDVKNEMRIKLKPEILGDMTMNIEVVKGEVIAKIMVDNQKTKEIIEGNLIQLKEGIKETGLEIKTVEVFVGNNSDFDKHNSKEFNLKQNNKKIKIKSQDRKAVVGYGEQAVENMTSTNETYVENGLNLFA